MDDILVEKSCIPNNQKAIDKMDNKICMVTKGHCHLQPEAITFLG